MGKSSFAERKKRKFCIKVEIFPKDLNRRAQKPYTSI